MIDIRRGSYAEEAAVELLAHAFGGRFNATRYGWLRACGRPGWYWLDGEALVNSVDGVSGGERRLLTVAGALVSGAALPDLSGVLAGLDRPNLELVLAALAHAAGSHEQVDAQVVGDRLVFRRLGPLVGWPDPVRAVS